VLAVLAALAGSLMYALASVLQQRGASEQPDDQSLRLGLLLLLVRHPWWVVGLLCDVAGFAFQVVALGHGPLVIVQPLLVSGLLFALPIGAAWAGRRLRRVDWIGAIAVCVGLALFLTVADPAEGHPNTTTKVWIVMLSVDAAVALGLILASRGGGNRRRAVLLSGAAGVIYAAAAALTKTTSHLLAGGVAHTLGHWQPYLLIVFGIGGMVVGQSAFQAGALDVSLPTMTVTDPVVSIMIGALAFGESVRSSPPAVALEVVGLVVMSLGVFLLARNEAVEPVAHERVL